MEKLKVLSLFSGIGAFEKSLSKVGIDYELVGFSETNKLAVDAYCKIHKVDASKNLGDIVNINPTEIEDFDLLCAGFPCTNISKNGKMEGFKTIDTKSGLVKYSYNIIKHGKPKYIVMENVKNLVSLKFKNDFEEFVRDIEAIGYKCSYKVLNSKDFGIPHNRERVYIIFIREEIDSTFCFENIKYLGESISLDNFLKKDDGVYNILEPVYNRILAESIDVDILSKKIEKRKPQKSKVVCLNSKNSEGKQPSQQYRVYSRYGLMTTLSAELNGRYNVISSYGHIRKLTTRECYLLQGFSEEDYECVRDIPQSSLYRQAGNSITVPVLNSIFTELLLKDN